MVLNTTASHGMTVLEEHSTIGNAAKKSLGIWRDKKELFFVNVVIIKQGIEQNESFFRVDTLPVVEQISISLKRQSILNKKLKNLNAEDVLFQEYSDELKEEIDYFRTLPSCDLLYLNQLNEGSQESANFLSVLIPVNLIDEHPLNSKIYGENEPIDDLIAVIDATNQFTPIEVKKNQDRYHVLSGHRRLRYAIHKGWKQVPAIIKVLPSDQEALAYLLASNKSRKKNSEQKIREAIYWKKIESSRQAKGRLRDRCAAHVGLSGRTFSEGKEVVDYLDSCSDVEKIDLVREALNNSIYTARKLVKKYKEQEKFVPKWQVGDVCRICSLGHKELRECAKWGVIMERRGNHLVVSTWDAENIVISGGNLASIELPSGMTYKDVIDLRDRLWKAFRALIDIGEDPKGLVMAMLKNLGNRTEVPALSPIEQTLLKCLEGCLLPQDPLVHQIRDAIAASDIAALKILRQQYDRTRYRNACKELDLESWEKLDFLKVSSKNSA